MKSGLLALGAILFACLRITAAAPQVSSAWFAGWHEKQFPPSKVPWNKYTNMKYAFAVTTPDPAKLDETPLEGLTAFVAEAKKNNVTSMVSIGGWTGSRFFSTAVGSEANRTAFVKAVVDLAQKFELGGVDFDWEYPNGLGVGCNVMGVNDTANFLSFLQALRKDSGGKKLLISAAVGITPWLGDTGTPVTDVSEFAKVLDYVAIMNYDVWGLSDGIVGPNSPLNETCGSKPSHGSAVSAVQTWTKAGMPPNKIVLGVAYYGRLFRVREKDANGNATDPDDLALYPPFDANDQPAGDQFDGVPGEPDVCGVKSTKPGGIIQFSGMITTKRFLDEEGKPLQGKKFKFDNCSETPFIYDPTVETMASYDDAQSMRLKGEFIKAQKLRGFAAWEVSGDFNTTLIDAILSTS